MNFNIIPYGKILSPKKLGRAVRAKRKSDGLTQAKAAALCGVGIRFISDLENGKSTIELGKALSVLDGLGLTIDIRPRGQLNQVNVKQHKTSGLEKTNQIMTFENPTAYDALSKLADSYKESFRISSKVLDDLSKHRKDYYSLGMSMDKFNDIAANNKYILDISNAAVNNLNNVQATIDKLGITNSTINNALNSFKNSASLSKDALLKIKKLQSTIGSLNLDTKVIDSLQKSYKDNLKFSRNAIRKFSDLKNIIPNARKKND